MDFFIKTVHPRPLFHLVSVFLKQTLQFLEQQITVKNIPPFYADLNSQPLEHESHLITTRPGLNVFEGSKFH